MRIVVSQALNPDEPEHKSFQPLGLGYLVAFAEQHIDNVEFVYEEGPEKILGAKPDVIAVSSVSENFHYAGVLAYELRKVFEGPIILGGIHVSMLPRSLPRQFDAGVIGEGENTFLELLRAISRRGAAWRDYRKSIDGLCYWSDNDMHVTGDRKLQRDLDSIPYPNRNILGGGWTNIDSGHQYIVSARGCPYDCSFCSSSHFWKKVRYFSSGYVLGELQSLIEDYSPHTIIFGDDLFISNKKRLAAISEGIIKTGMSEEVGFLCNVRSNEVDEDLCATLVRMNVKGVALGLESGSDRVLELMNKRATVNHHLRALRLLKDAGLVIIASFILGIPGETEDDMKLTIDFIERNHEGCFDFEVYPLIAYPGTRFWQFACSEGIITEDTSSEIFNLGAFGFDPDRYVYLNQAAPRDTFLYYLFYLKYIAYRSVARRQAADISILRREQQAFKDRIASLEAEREVNINRIEELERR